MVNSCCVPLCHTKSTREKELSFHRFPKCELLKKAWLVKIRHDEGESFTVSEHTRVCSLHFTSSDYRTTLGGKTVLVVKDKFIWAWKCGSERTMRELSGEGPGYLAA